MVGSPTMALLKQDTSLKCNATDPTTIDPHCPGYEVVAQGDPMPTPEAAAMQLFQLEEIRQAYIGGAASTAMAASGCRRTSSPSVGFPHPHQFGSVLLPGTAAVPHVPAANQIVVGVQGPVDPATVSAFTVRRRQRAGGGHGSTAAGAGDLNAGFPPVAAAYVASVGAIAIQSSAPFPAGHTLGLFFTNAIHSPTARRWSPRRCRSC